MEGIFDFAILFSIEFQTETFLLKIFKMTPLSLNVLISKNFPKVKKILLKNEKSGMQDLRT